MGGSEVAEPAPRAKCGAVRDTEAMKLAAVRERERALIL
jgi:hypothetical protein